MSNQFEEGDDEAYWLSQIDSKPSTRFNAKTMSSLVKKSLGKHRVSAVFEATISEEIWLEVVGQELAKFSRPGKIQRGRLIVQVTDSIVEQEFAFQKSDIVRRLQSHPEFAKVRSLKFVVR